MDNIIFEQSVFPKQRGEFLPYFYFYYKKYAKHAMIIHDGLMIHKKIPNNFLLTNTYNPICSIDGTKQLDHNSLNLILSEYNDKKIIHFKNKIIGAVFMEACVLLIMILIKKYLMINYLYHV